MKISAPPFSKGTGKGIPLNPLGLARLGIAIPPPPPGAPGGTAKGAGVELLMGAASRWSQLRRKNLMDVVTTVDGRNPAPAGIVKTL